MNAIDGTEHYERQSDAPAPSLLVIILDTNPYAWSQLSPGLTLSKAVADLQIFINAHLAFNHDNRAAVIASHCQRTKWLYPSADRRPDHFSGAQPDVHPNGTTSHPDSDDRNRRKLIKDANKYRPFRLIEEEVVRNLQDLFATTTPAELRSTNTTLLAGALTLALSYINKTSLSLSASAAASSSANPSTFAGDIPTDSTPATQAQSGAGSASQPTLNARVLVVSTSGDLASQYIPLMNLIFAAQHARIPIDILKLAGDMVLLQQASYTTAGIFLAPTPDPPGAARSQDRGGSSAGASGAAAGKAPATLLPYLLQALLPDATARRHLLAPTNTSVDFRAACFCHRRVLDVGFVCSVCLSIFCDEGAEAIVQQQQQQQSSDAGGCLTCGTRLSLVGVEGLAGVAAEQAPRKKKKRREAGSGVGTPQRQDTPANGAA